MIIWLLYNKLIKIYPNRNKHACLMSSRFAITQFSHRWVYNNDQRRWNSWLGWITRLLWEVWSKGDPWKVLSYCTDILVKTNKYSGHISGQFKKQQQQKHFHAIVLTFCCCCCCLYSFPDFYGYLKAFVGLFIINSNNLSNLMNTRSN